MVDFHFPVEPGCCGDHNRHFPTATRSKGPGAGKPGEAIWKKPSQRRSSGCPNVHISLPPNEIAFRAFFVFYLARFPNCIVYQSRGWGTYVLTSQAILAVRYLIKKVSFPACRKYSIGSSGVSLVVSL